MLCRRGEVKRKLGQLEEALTSYEKSVSLLSTVSSDEQETIDHLAQAWRGWGLVHKKHCRYEEAMSCYESAMMLLFDRPPLINLLGLIHVDRGDVLRKLNLWNESLVAYELALKFLKGPLDRGDALCAKCLVLLESQTQMNEIPQLLSQTRAEYASSLPSDHHKFALLDLIECRRQARLCLSDRESIAAIYRQFLACEKAFKACSELEVADCILYRLEFCFAHLKWFGVQTLEDPLTHISTIFAKHFALSHPKNQICQTLQTLLHEKSSSSSSSSSIKFSSLVLPDPFC